MKQEYNTNQLKYLGWLSNYQMIFGVIGVILLLLKIGLAFEVESGLIFFIIKVLLYAITIYAGVQYHLGEYKSCILFSKVNLVLQVFGLYYWGFIYEYSVGLSAIVDWFPEFNAVSGRMHLGTTNLYLGEGEGTIISLNIVAIILLLLLFRIEKGWYITEKSM